VSKPTAKNCAVLVRHERWSTRAARVGKAPLVHIWVQEDGNGGRGMYLDVEAATELIEGLNDLLDEIEGEVVE
jgi:hypothetical protein